MKNDKLIMCGLKDDDFRGNPPVCHNYNPDFVERMAKHSTYWNLRKEVGPLKFQDVQLSISELTVFDEVIKNKIDSPKEQFELLEKEILEKAEQSLLEYFKLKETNIPDEVIIAFIRMFIDFELVMDRDVSRCCNILRVNCSWKPVDMIDFDCEEANVINELLY